MKCAGQLHSASGTWRPELAEGILVPQPRPVDARAGNLDAATALARGCPLLAQGGAVEICELASHDDRFDNWLDTIGDRS